MITIGENIVEELKINKLKLDEECTLQPSLYYYYSEQLALEKSHLEHLNNKMKILLGEKNLYYRKNPPVDIKITESVIESLINTDSDIMALQEQISATMEKVSLLFSAINALEQKKESLNNLIKLLSIKYFDVDTYVSNDIRAHLNGGNKNE